MPLKLFFTQTEFEEQPFGWDGCDWAVTMKDQILQSPNTEYEITERPEEAEIIVFWEPHQQSQVIRIPRLRTHPLIHQFPNRVFVVSIEDAPLGLLSGLYASLPARRHHRYRHRTSLYYETRNPYLDAIRTSRHVSDPPHLASFSGADSHALRFRLLEMADLLAEQNIIVTATERHKFQVSSDPQLKPFQLAFIDAILNAKFSLCPRGNGIGSYRVQESLALGRAPVIISDDWVPAADLDWQSFAIFVTEDSLHELPEILREHEPRWKQMGDIARQTYEARFKPSVFAQRSVEQILAIHKSRRHDERHFFAHWQQMMEAAD
ncbi:MAG TPA: exostosin family protein [Pyrinomonadaceae bacterium]|jgi:hypothetical protein|nr:exostosin family protein [Pyrinomonadaceae bacterium]